MEKKAHLALYRKWRPSTFDEVYGQEHITSVLKYETGNNRFSHAYLFCGSRGTGKTSCAKILAKAVNCLNPQGGNPCGICVACRAIESGATTDVLEMDAASNNGVDNIRDIRDEVVYSPSSLKYRVYIIDEVHMLSASAFNALLKTLEEPPAHVVFILATTEMHKLPATIVSRCQRFDFRRISTDIIITHLNRIAAEEGIELEADAAHQLARLAQGGMRDAISLLELAAGGQRRITAETVADAVGSTGRGKVIETAKAIACVDCDAIFRTVADVVNSSKDIAVFWQELISLYRDMLVMKTTADAAKYLDLTDTETAQLKEVTQLFKKETLLAHCRLLDDAYINIQRAGAVRRTIAELTLIRMSDGKLDTSNESLLSRIAKLEDAASCSSFTGQPQTSNVTGPLTKNSDSEPLLTDTGAQQKIENEKTFTADTLKPDTAKAVKNLPKTQDDTQKTKRVLKTLRNWVETIGRLSRSKQSLAALLTGSKAYIDPDGRVLLRFENQFSIFMIEREKAKDLIRAALSAEIGRELKDSDIIYEVVSPGNPADGSETIFDEIDNMNTQGV